jgi:methylated-DNA-[protein]-cysteine S-methyltransferase
MMTLHQQHLETPIGVLTLVASDVGLSMVLFESEDSAEIDATLDESDPVLRAAATQLSEYFAGERREFDLPLDLEGTDFQKEAWLALAGVPYGETTSYGEQARAIGRPGAFRAVGAANGKNPLPIVLPCHRIVGADGSLTGFAGGLDIKQQLLVHEQNQQSLPGV